jgi:hypothetical protein
MDESLHAAECHTYTQTQVLFIVCISIARSEFLNASIAYIVCSFTHGLVLTAETAGKYQLAPLSDTRPRRDAILSEFLDPSQRE